MTDERRPPRFPRRPPPLDIDVLRVDEDPPLTNRSSTIIPPAPRAPAEPFKLIGGRPPSYVEFQAQLGEFTQKLEGVLSSQAAVLGVQRKMALQLDGFGTTVNERFDVFHKELALLRVTVTVDHAPRLEGVEKGVEEVKELTRAQKAGAAALTTGKWGGYLVLAGLVARAIGKMFPQYQALIDGLLAPVGL